MPSKGELDRSRLFDRYTSSDFFTHETEIGYGEQVLRPFVQEVRKVCQKGRVLYIASGTGEVARYLEQFDDIKVVQLDLSQIALTVADGNRIRSLADDPPFKNDSFDAIHMKDALVHIGDIDGFSAKLDSLLVPGGKLLITSVSPRRYKKFFVIPGEKDQTVYFSNPDDYLNKSRILLNGKITTFSAPYYPRNPARITRILAANHFLLIGADSWTPTSELDWYGKEKYARDVFLYEKRSV
jgi:SAM-dependent methyltransferase